MYSAVCAVSYRAHTIYPYPNITKPQEPHPQTLRLSALRALSARRSTPPDHAVRPPRSTRSPRGRGSRVCARHWALRSRVASPGRPTRRVAPDRGRFCAAFLVLSGSPVDPNATPPSAYSLLSRSRPPPPRTRDAADGHGADARGRCILRNEMLASQYTANQTRLLVASISVAVHRN